MFWSAAVVAAALVARVSAQTSPVRCTYAEWTINDNGETSCTVWAQLQNICTPGTTVGPITNVTAPYPSPSGSTATDCNCNYIAYNLMAGCSWCQPGIYSSDWVSETSWKSACPTYYSTNLPSSISARALALDLPPFVFLTNNGDKWSSFEASVANGDLASVTSPTASATGSASTTRSRTTARTSSTGLSSGGDDDFGASTVASGVVVLAVVLGLIGGIPLLGYIVVLFVYMNRQNKRKAFYGPLAAYYQSGGMPPATAAPPVSPTFAPQPMGGPSFQPYPQQPYSPVPQTSYSPGPQQVGTPSTQYGQLPGQYTGHQSQYGAPAGFGPQTTGGSQPAGPTTYYTTAAPPAGSAPAYQV